jgi:hypothetical protein
MLELRPVTLREAQKFVDQVHRHHDAPQGHRVSVGVMYESGNLRAVGVLGRPVARGADDGFTAEITRVASDGAPNACSMIYGALTRAARALGYRRVITYTLSGIENGASLRASGWQVDGETSGGEWKRSEGKPRKNTHPTTPKIRWVRLFNKTTYT